MTTMTSQRYRAQEPERPRWKSLVELASLWGLSRARARLVLESLVQSGRMEVRDLDRDRENDREYRVRPRR